MIGPCCSSLVDWLCSGGNSSDPTESCGPGRERHRIGCCRMPTLPYPRERTSSNSPCPLVARFYVDSEYDSPNGDLFKPSLGWAFRPARPD